MFLVSIFVISVLCLIPALVIRYIFKKTFKKNSAIALTVLFCSLGLALATALCQEWFGIEIEQVGIFIMLIVFSASYKLLTNE